MPTTTPTRAATRVAPEELYRPCDPATLPFDSTAGAADTPGIIGQDRAVEAVRFGIEIRREGYNLYALGPHGVGKQSLLRQFLDPRAAKETTPSDWCYVTNLEDPLRPRALELPPGMGARLRDDLKNAITALRGLMRAAFQGDEYRTKKLRLVARFKEREEAAFAVVQERAKQRSIALARSDTGLVVAPLHDGAPMHEAEFEKLPAAERERYKERLEQVSHDLQAFFAQVHEWTQESRAAFEELDRTTAADSARTVLDRIRPSYEQLPEVMKHLAAVETDVVSRAAELLEESEDGGFEAAFRRALQRGSLGTTHRYAVNLLIDNAGGKGAPVVYEDNPTHANLIGRIDSVSQLGATITDSTMIRAGALHRARGGYLLLDVLDVLREPFAWDSLKRAIRSRQVRTEPLGRVLGITPTLPLEPEPIPLGETKIILIGERTLYYLLSAYDHDFLELFKVMVDFEDNMDRGPESQRLYAQLIASLATKEQLRPLDRTAVARVIERAARIAGDAEKLSVHMRRMADLLREADYWAVNAGHEIVSAADVQAAIDAQERRAGRLRERIREATRRQTLVVETTGARVGQVNGLSVITLGEESFGHPTRITARARMGKGEVVDIEREVDLGGPIHSKGVLILTGFLGSLYATRVPLSLKASLVFEQSYGGVEGDSASLAELCALLSAIGEIPIEQSLAVTGSVDQHGRVQAIGGVNEKIEGFFDACSDRGLTGDQGVLIPKSNVKHLMLRKDVVEAVVDGRFHVHAVENVDQAIEILTGRPAGDTSAGAVPEPGSVHAAVEARLLAFANDARSFMKDESTDRKADSGSTTR
ncbi:MAG: AAA family ATPase [Deltaproteobacteria bacterium]|nr:AAA family ATPase [Deltaproteobacteria bacterium]